MCKPLVLEVELEFGSAGFYGGRKTGEPGEKPQSKEKTNNKLNPHANHWDRTQVTEVESEYSHHYANLAPKIAL